MSYYELKKAMQARHERMNTYACLKAERQHISFSYIPIKQRGRRPSKLDNMFKLFKENLCTPQLHISTL